MAARFSVALLLGLLAGLASGAAWRYGAAATPPLPLAQMAVLGMACGAALHAIAQARRVHAAGLGDNAFVFRAFDRAGAPRWLVPVVPMANRFAARDPQRLIKAYRSFHLLVTCLFAAAWLTALWFIAAALGQATGGGWWLIALSVPASACVAWWTVSGLCVAIAVQAGVLPPFGVAPYVRAGVFPSHWIAKAYVRDV